MTMGARRWWALLLVALAGCASPATTRDAAPRTEEIAPRFVAGGPDAEVYGAANGYPIGDRSTFYDIPVLVGSHSHLDEVFEARLIHKAPTPSRLVRVAEPAIAWTFQGLELTLDDYLARNPATGLLIARGNTIFVERYQYELRQGWLRPEGAESSKLATRTLTNLFLSHPALPADVR